MQFCKFPEKFLWGAATSSYQVEGNNTLSDWYEWEKQKKTGYSCGVACDSYKRFREDFDIAKSLGHNAHRFSLEWSRIQPSRKVFNSNEISHYRQVIEALLSRRIEPVLTTHHFTNPAWFAGLGGWYNRGSADLYAEYVSRVVKEFSSLVNIWITVNEPLVYVYNSYYKGLWPPGEASLFKSLRVLNNLVLAHNKAYDIIHSSCPQAKVGIAKHMRFFSPCRDNNIGQNLVPVFLRKKVFNFFLLNRLVKEKKIDFIGVNYYTGDFVRFSFGDIFGKECYLPHHRIRRNSLGWYVNPEKMTDILLGLKKYSLPVIITENGTAQINDNLSGDFLKRHIFSIYRALSEGADIRGYLWWSLIDNFEWDKGFGPKFGLVSVDKRMGRKIKPYAYRYKEVCLSNGISV